MSIRYKIRDNCCGRVMGAIILKNATYLAGFNLASNDVEALKALSKKFRVRTFHESDFSEFKKSFDQVKYYFAVVLKIDETNKDPESEARKYISSFNVNKVFLDPEDLCPDLSNEENCLRLGKNDLAENNGEILENKLVELIDGKINGGIKDVITQTMEYITPIFFSCDKVNYKSKSFDPDFFDFTKPELFNCLVCIENNFEWLVGRLVLKINSDLFAKNILKADKDIEEILKASQEFSNQIMGIINYNLNQNGRKFKIGLPQSYDLSNSRVNLGKLLIPSMILQSEGGEIEISFGYVEMENGTVPNLEVDDFSTPSSDVDFF